MIKELFVMVKSIYSKVFPNAGWFERYKQTDKRTTILYLLYDVLSWRLNYSIVLLFSCFVLSGVWFALLNLINIFSLNMKKNWIWRVKSLYIPEFNKNTSGLRWDGKLLSVNLIEDMKVFHSKLKYSKIYPIQPPSAHILFHE